MPTLHPTAVAQNLRLPVMTDNPWPSGNQNKKWWPYWSLDWAQTNCRQVLMMLNWCSKFGEDISFGSWGIVWKPNIHTHTHMTDIYTPTLLQYSFDQTDQLHLIFNSWTLLIKSDYTSTNCNCTKYITLTTHGLIRCWNRLGQWHSLYNTQIMSPPLSWPPLAPS